MGPIGFQEIILILLVLALNVLPVVIIVGAVLWIKKKKNEKER